MTLSVKLLQQLTLLAPTTRLLVSLKLTQSVKMVVTVAEALNYDSAVDSLADYDNLDCYTLAAFLCRSLIHLLADRHDDGNHSESPFLLVECLLICLDLSFPDENHHAFPLVRRASYHDLGNLHVHIHHASLGRRLYYHDNHHASVDQTMELPTEFVLRFPFC